MSKLKIKQWDKKFEKEIFEKWEKNKIYSFKENNRKVFSIDTPPPYASGGWHMGHAASYGQIDMIARYKRMKGFNVLFPMGLDRNGLPVEVQTAKHFNINMRETPREEFLNKVKEFLEIYSDRIINVAKSLGLSCNSWKKGNKIGDLYETDSSEYRRITQAVFIELFKKGLIKEDSKPNNWCSGCGTTLANAEIEYKKEKTKLYHLKFKIKNSEEHVIVATTRPELLCTTAVVLFNPKDERYKKYEGKTLMVPEFNQEVKLIAHPYADMNFGSGLVMISSFGDYSDIRLFRELKLKPKYAIDINGKMTSACKNYEGLTIKKAREKIIESLKNKKIVVKEESLIHNQPVCWRCETPIEFVNMSELYLEQVKFKKEILKIINKIKFYPKQSKQLLIDWIKSIDMEYPISRRRYYGTEIPLWYCNKCGETIIPEPGKYYQPWKEKSPIKKCPKCGSANIRGEERVFDTWMDSGISELYITGYLRHKDFFKKNFPASIRPQGKDIVRTWAYYTIHRAYLLFKQIPWYECWIHQHVVDDKGKKMSKSKGNVVNPIYMVEKYGGEALRLWSALEGSLHKTDLRCSEERIKGNMKFINKLWNVARFISLFNEKKKPKKLVKTDEWIINELKNILKKSIDGYEKYDFHIPAKEIRNFVWNIFAGNYLEMIKPRAYNKENKFSENEQNSAIYTMHFCLKEILKALSPIIPFVTEKLWQEIYSKKSIHLEKFPESKVENKNMLKLTEKIIEFNSFVWKSKKEKGISLRERIEGIEIPKELKIFEKDLKLMHNLS